MLGWKCQLMFTGQLSNSKAIINLNDQKFFFVSLKLLSGKSTECKNVLDIESEKPLLSKKVAKLSSIQSLLDRELKNFLFHKFLSFWK